MDVGCPKCQTEYELDDARVTEDGVTVKCTSCGHVFRVKKKQLVVTLPARGDAPIQSLGPPSSSHAELPPAPPSREWKLRQPSGNVFPCRDLTMLQKWIIEGKVARDDEISLTGETWKRLGNIPELASFFQIVDDASKVRAMEALHLTGPGPSAPRAPPPGPGKITDTWRGGQFSAPAPDNAVPETSENETLPPEPPPPRKSTTSRNPQFTPAPQTPVAPPITETLQGGRFTAPPPAARPPRPEPTDEELRRAVGKGGGSGKWIALILAGLAVGGAVGWYFGVYEPEQQRLADEREAVKARLLEEAARVRALPPTPVVVVLDASVEDEAEQDAGAPDAGAPDAGAPDAGAPDAGQPVVDAGVPVIDAGPAAPVVVEQKKTFDWYLAQGDRLRERDKPEQALDFYGKASELKPERVEPVTGRGLSLLDMANPSAAVATFETALKLNGRYGPAIMGLAEAYRIMGKNEKAVEFYERYLDVLPNGAEAPVARNSIERLKK